jgi:hypothetical protein
LARGTPSLTPFPEAHLVSVKNFAVIVVAVAATSIVVSCQRDQVTGLGSGQRLAPAGRTAILLTNHL